MVAFLTASWVPDVVGGAIVALPGQAARVGVTPQIATSIVSAPAGLTAESRAHAGRSHPGSWSVRSPSGPARPSLLCLNCHASVTRRTARRLPLSCGRARLPLQACPGRGRGAGRVARADLRGIRAGEGARGAAGGTRGSPGARPHKPAPAGAADRCGDRQGDGSDRARRGGARTRRHRGDAERRARRRARAGRNGRPPARLLRDRARGARPRPGLPGRGDGRAGAHRVSAVPALAVRELRKSYGEVEAVAGISFTVEQGEVFGLLGPNGAGKTTTVEILEGYRTRDGGEVTVLGIDPEHGGSALRERIGVVLQASDLPAALTVREVHQMFAGYYDHPRDVDEVIALVGLGEKSGSRVKTLSGGQKRRLDLGVALVGDPELLFLDEPTTGFDPAARRTAWELVRSLRALGKTILLTTHYLDEAQQLADRVAVIRDGRIVKQGSPAELIGVAPKVEIRYREGGQDVVVSTDEPTRLLAELAGKAVAEGRELDSLEVVRPSLEDVYLDLIDDDEDTTP